MSLFMNGDIRKDVIMFLFCFVFEDDTSSLWNQLSLPSPQRLSKILTSQHAGTHRRGASQKTKVNFLPSPEDKLTSDFPSSVQTYT